MNPERELTEVEVNDALIEIISECMDFSGDFPVLNQMEMSRRIRLLFADGNPVRQ